MCGSNNKGELGFSNCTKIESPTQIEFPGNEAFIYIVCRNESVMAISKKTKQIWVWGENSYFKLGMVTQDANKITGAFTKSMNANKQNFFENVFSSSNAKKEIMKSKLLKFVF